MESTSRKFKIFSFVIVASILLCDCVQAYVSPYKSPATGYLVVDGFISGNGPTQYTLTRTTQLPGDSAVPVVTGAYLQVEGSDNSIYPLTEEGNGVYGTGALALNTALRYRLSISLPGGESYVSDYVPYKPTPPIDSVNWVQDSGGVTIYVNTHDPGNGSRYYQWSYDQTWEYHSGASSAFTYLPSSNTVVPRPDSSQNFTCWKDAPATAITIGTSALLAQDEIYLLPLVQIPTNSQQLSVEYSIIVRQYALTDSAYAFLSLMRQNTESLGSIFDAQPTQLTGNIHSVSNPNEQVIGYISAGTLQQERIFISNDQLRNWFYDYQCEPPKIVADDPDSFAFYFAGQDYVPLYQNFGPTGPLFGFFSNHASCVDCTIQGGATVKPTFWPN